MTIKVIEARKTSAKDWSAEEMWNSGCCGDAFVDDSGYIHVVCINGLNQVVVVFCSDGDDPLVFDRETFFEHYEENTFRPINVELKWTYK